MTGLKTKKRKMSRKKGRWIKERKRTHKYPKTEQQKKVAEAGNLVKEKCTGLKENEFYTCRKEVLRAVFKKLQEED